MGLFFRSRSRSAALFPPDTGSPQNKANSSHFSHEVSRAPLPSAKAHGHLQLSVSPYTPFLTASSSPGLRWASERPGHLTPPSGPPTLLPLPLGWAPSAPREP